MHLTGTVPARNLGGTRPMPPRLVVVHTTESHEVKGGARAVANYFANPASDASAHIVVDDADTIRSVPDNRIAYTALGANIDGLHVEIVGSAGQGADGWADDYSQKALRRAADVVRDWCDTYGIPVRKLGSDDVKAGKHGICGHVNVSQAYGQSTHTDPGPTFPWGQFLDLVNGDDMPLSDADVQKVADAVWAKLVEDPVQKDTVNFGTLLRRIRLALK